MGIQVSLIERRKRINQAQSLLVQRQFQDAIAEVGGVERAVSSGRKDVPGAVSRDSGSAHPDRASSIRIGGSGSAGSGDEHALPRESRGVVGK